MIGANMGLLDYDFAKALNSDQGRLGLGLLAAAGPSQMGFGQRLQSALGYVQGQQDRDMQKQMQQFQMQDLMAQAQKRKRDAEMQAQTDAEEKAVNELAKRFMTQPTAARSATDDINAALPDYMRISPTPGAPSQAGGFDQKAFLQNLPSVLNPLKAMEYTKNFAPKEEEAFTLGEGQIRYKGDKVIAQGPKKVPELPSAVREYEYAQSQGYQGSFNDFQTAQKKAGASNISMKVDNKMGESLASQVGGMAKDSRIQTQGAVKMFDAADRIEKALASNKVTAGPMANQIQTVKQFAQVIGGGNDDSIRQTRQVIKSLAQMSVEARKQLQGQGQVTESEAAAVAKADSGDIGDLTTGELQDLVTLTKRAANYQAKSHADLLGTLGGKEETKNLVPFYSVQGLEPLLKHSPSLPQIGAPTSIDPLVEKYRSR